MWAESTKNGKVRFVERYMEPLTGQYRKVSVVMKKKYRRREKTGNRDLTDPH